MNTISLRRLIIMSGLTILAACSSVPVATHEPTERVNRIVEAIREASSLGFIDVTINFVKPNLYISGHSYSSAHVARLMRAANLDIFSNLQIVDIHSQEFEGRNAFVFQLVDSSAGDIRNWSGPISLKYPPSSNATEISGDMLHLFSLYKFAFVGATGVGDQRKAVIRFQDGVMYLLKVGHTLGKEQAIVKEINDSSVVLFEQSGRRHELRITGGN